MLLIGEIVLRTLLIISTIFENTVGESAERFNYGFFLDVTDEERNGELLCTLKAEC